MARRRAAVFSPQEATDERPNTEALNNNTRMKGATKTCAIRSPTRFVGLPLHVFG